MTSADYRNEERKLTAFEAIARARALLVASCPECGERESYHPPSGRRCEIAQERAEAEFNAERDAS